MEEDAFFYSMRPAETLRLLGSSRNGLSAGEAADRLREHGRNEIDEEKRAAALRIFAGQFRNALIMLLVFAGALSLLLGEAIESAAIFSIILLNAVLGFVQEYKAEKAVEALKSVSARTARVVREGREMRLPAAEVVPGDILLLEAGDIVAADARLIEVSSLHIDEASLTGESVPSNKVTGSFRAGTSVADQENMAFMGTVVTYGKGVAVVTRTGMGTEFGKIAASLQSTAETQTPLQMKFTQLTKQIGMIAVFLIIMVFAAGVLQGTSTFSRMVLLALALTVSTIPNSLPIIVTVSLSRGTKRLARKNMLIKKLTAAESLGAATVICSDKTGTITKNQMTITDIYCGGRQIQVTGSGYEPEGSFHSGGSDYNPKGLETLMRIGYLCNNAKLEEKDGSWGIVGDPTEGSLVVLARKGGLDEKSLREGYRFVAELPFDSDRKMMSVVHRRLSDGRTEACVKGAPDELLKRCTKVLDGGRARKLSRKDEEEISRMNDSFAGKALRVLALAYRQVEPSRKYAPEKVECGLTFVGLVGMMDPPREGVGDAVARCREAGIRVMIITGDHAMTTRAVARQIGLLGKDDIVLTGEDIGRMSDGELESVIENVRIVARALPIQKSRIVDALQKKGHVVAMTGDGVNDAPALKKADIGIAMGITGTEVAKEVAKAILVDDNFATIVNAIEEGRGIYGKIIKSAKYLLSCNAGEITAVFMAIMVKLPLPLLPLQVLLMNLLTDDLPAMGLGSEGNERGLMRAPPRKPSEKPIRGRLLASIVLFGLIMGIGTLLMFVHYLQQESAKAQTAAFTTLVMFQMFAVMSARTYTPSLRNLNLLSNKWLLVAVCFSLLVQVAVVYWQPMQAVFGTVPLDAADWAVMAAVSSMGFFMMEASKTMSARFAHVKKR